MTRFWWVRHGPTKADGLIGWTDVPADLSDTDRVARLAAYLPDAPVISSDLLRAAATADAILGDRRRLDHDPDLRELHFGAWEARPFKDLFAEAGEELRLFYDAPGDTRPPAGESWNDITARVTVAVDRLLSGHGGTDVIVVAHMGTILTQVQRALGLSAHDTLAHRIDNLSVTRIRFDGGWQAEAINHLP